MTSSIVAKNNPPSFSAHPQKQETKIAQLRTLCVKQVKSSWCCSRDFFLGVQSLYRCLPLERKFFVMVCCKEIFDIPNSKISEQIMKLTPFQTRKRMGILKPRNTCAIPCNFPLRKLSSTPNLFEPISLSYFILQILFLILNQKMKVHTPASN